MIAVISLGAGQLALVAALILLNAGLSLAYRLKLERQLFVAALRAVVQLSLLGFVLGWIFSTEGPTTVLVWMLGMAFVAGTEAVRRTTHRVRGIYGVSVSVVITTSMLVTLYGLLAVIRVEPWYEPQYAIPILGMVLGNTLNGISLGLETVLAGFADERAKIEVLLAHGATRSEAAHGVVRRAVRTGLVPVINMLVAAGLVSIPGMMTGQILSGEDPADAARYQIFILFLIAGGVALGTVTMVLLSSRLVFDERGRLRADRIRKLSE